MAKASLPKTAISSIPILEQKVLTLDALTNEVLVHVSQYLTQREVQFNNILEFIHHPEPYPGNPNQMQYIVEHFLNKVVSEQYHLLQKTQIPINFAYKTIFNKILKRGKK